MDEHLILTNVKKHKEERNERLRNSIIRILRILEGQIKRFINKSTLLEV